MLANGEPCDVKEEFFSRLKRVMNVCMDDLSANLVPGAPEMIVDAVKLDAIKQEKNSDSKAITTLVEVYKAHEKNMGGTSKRILRAVLAGGYTKKQLELHFGIKMANDSFRDGKLVLEELKLNHEITTKVRQLRRFDEALVKEMLDFALQSKFTGFLA